MYKIFVAEERWRVLAVKYGHKNYNNQICHFQSGFFCFIFVGWFLHKIFKLRTAYIYLYMIKMQINLPLYYGKSYIAYNMIV
jgi:hypothetical protein